MKSIVTPIIQWILPDQVALKLNQEGPRRYFFHTSWNLAGRMLSLILAFFVSVYVIRYLGPSSWGLLSYVVSFTGIFAFVASLGVDNILYVDLVNDPKRRDLYLGTAFGLKLIGGILAFVITLAVSYFSGNSAYTNFLMAVVAAGFFFQPLNVVNTYFQAGVNSKPTVILSLAVNVCLSVLKIIFVNMGLTVGYFLLIYFIEAVLSAAGYLFIYRWFGLSVLQWRWANSAAKTIFTASWPLILSSAFTFVYSRIDQVMIKQLLNQTAVGLYDTGVRLAELWYIFPSIIIGSVFPAIINAKKNNFELFESRITRLYFFSLCLALGFIIPISVLSGFIIKLLYGTAFLPAAGVLKIYVWAGVSVTLATIVNQYLISEKLTRISLYLNLFGMLLNIALNILFIPRYGIYGAAWATLISYSLIPAGLVFFKSGRGQFRYMSRALRGKI